MTIMCMIYEEGYLVIDLAQGAIYSRKDVRDYKLVCGVSVKHGLLLILLKEQY